MELELDAVDLAIVAVETPVLFNAVRLLALFLFECSVFPGVVGVVAREEQALEFLLMVKLWVVIRGARVVF